MRWAILLLAVVWPAVFHLRAAEGDIVQYGVAAVVNDWVITWLDVFLLTRPSLESLARDTGKPPSQLKEEQTKILNDGLEMLIEQQLVLEEAKTVGINLPESFIEDQIKNRIRERYGDRVSLIKDLRAKGMTYESYRQRIRNEIYAYIMQRRNVGSVILISPTKIDRYYQANIEKYRETDQVRLRGIVLNAPTAKVSAEARKRAAEITRKMDEGISFSEMASVYSEGSQSQLGGDWGWFERTKLWKGLADVVFAMKPRERTHLIGRATEPDASYWVFLYDAQIKLAMVRKFSADQNLVEERKIGGNEDALKAVPEPREYYLILVEDKRSARVRPLTDVQDEIEKELIRTERRRLERKWVDRLRQKFYVRYTTGA
jgi:peptidyl-prolyl cis-trans isomerase SurA